MISGARALGLIVFSVALSTAGQTALKMGLARVSPAQKASIGGFIAAIVSSPLVILGLSLFVGSVLVWMRVLADNDLSWAYPLLGLSYVFVALSGWIVFDERLSLMRISGIAFVLLGAILISRS